MNERSSQTVVDQLIRWAGPLGVVGGIALAGAYLAHPPEASPETVASTAWFWIHVGFMVSLLCGVFLLTGLLVVYFRAGGGLSGFAGFAMALTSLIFVFGLDYSEVFIFPTLATEFPEVVERYGDGTMMPSVAFAFPATGILFLLGFVLFGWALDRVRAVPRNVIVLTIVGTTVFAIGLSGMFPMIVVRVGAVLFGAALVSLGLVLRRHPA